MKNCLITELNAVVNNNNIPFYGSYKLHFARIDGATDKSNGLRGYANMNGDDGKIHVKGNTLFADSSLVSQGVQEMVAVNNTSFYVTNQDGILLVSDKSTNIEAIAGATSVAKGYYIKTEEFEDSTSIVVLALSKANLSEGSILHLAGNIGLTNLNLAACPNITGSISDFVIRQIDEFGRTSGSISITLNGSGCTVDGSAAATSASYTVTIASATSFTITNQNGTITWTGTKTGDNWSVVPQ